MKEPFVSKILKYALYFIFISGVLMTIALPRILKWHIYMAVFYDSYIINPGYRTFLMVFLYTVAIPSLWIVLEMILMLRSVPKGPFIMRNVRALNRIGVIFLFLAAAFFGKCLLYITILTFLCGVLFIVGGLFAFTLAALIRKAVVFREENDLTI